MQIEHLDSFRVIIFLFPSAQFHPEWCAIQSSYKFNIDLFAPNLGKARPPAVQTRRLDRAFPNYWKQSGFQVIRRLNDIFSQELDKALQLAAPFDGSDAVVERQAAIGAG
mgnify:CR=1 FL=1